jgi:23S rRNA (uracil1939-C5)-methyltransferase
VRALVDSLTPRFAKASVTEVLAPSPDETPAPCPHAALCGGCAWQNLAYPAQLAWKERQARETLRRIGKQDPERLDWGAEPMAASPALFRYRNKVELAFGRGPDGPVLGMRRRASREIVEIEDCLLARRPLGRLLELVRAWAAESGLTAWDGGQGFLRFLVLRMPEYDPGGRAPVAVELISAKSPRSRPREAEAVRKLFAMLERALPEVVSCAHSQRGHKADVAYGERVLSGQGERRLREKIGPVLLETPLRAFVQTNPGAAALLYENVRSLAALSGRELVWDLYCGVGGIGLLLAQDAAAVRGFDLAGPAVACARKNAALNKLANCSFAEGDLAVLLAKEENVPELVVMDPPRAGLDARVRAALLEKGPRRIISVSCDPATQARDMAALRPLYSPRAGRLIDLFPHTPHLESVYLLEKA